MSAPFVTSQSAHFTELHVFGTCLKIGTRKRSEGQTFPISRHFTDRLETDMVRILAREFISL